MTVRLRSVLTMAELGLELVTGETGLDREVRRLVTTDSNTPGRYLTGGELVLTGLHWRRDPADSDAFVGALAAAGAAGLLAGQARYDGIPADLVDACARHRLPLLRLPQAVSFAAVTERVNRELSAGRAGQLSAVLDRHRSYLAGDGFAPIVELVEDHLGLRCWILTTVGRTVAGTAVAPPAAATAAFLTAPALPTVLCDNGITYTVLAISGEPTPRMLDWMLILEGDHAEWPAEHRLLVGELTALAGQMRARRHGDGLARQLLDLVVSDADPALLRSRLTMTGLGADGHYLAVAATGPRPEHLPDLSLLLCDMLDGTAPLAAASGDMALALLRADDSITARLHRHVAELTAGPDGGPLRVGVSGVVDLDGLHGAVEEARYACRIAAELPGPGQVIGRDELGSRTALFAGVPERTRRGFRRRLLDPLLAYDRDHRADLVNTLETFLDVSGSWAKCADLLYVHVSTVRYRIQRIEELTGRDLSRFDDRVDFYLALSLR